MTITLTPDQLQRLEEAVAAGRFPSIESAVRLAVADLIGSLGTAEDDLDWVKPLLDDARADAAAGRTVPLDDVRAELTQRIAMLRDQ